MELKLFYQKIQYGYEIFTILKKNLKKFNLKKK